MKSIGEVISLTFGDSGENHVGMEQIGVMVEPGEGFNLEDFKQYREIFNKKGCVVQIHHLNRILTSVGFNKKAEDAYVMVVRNGMNALLSDIGKTDKDIYKEMIAFEWDSKYYDVRRKKVLNKHARSNVCFSEGNSSEPDYENKKGRMISFDDVPSLKHIKKQMAEQLGEKCQNLICEGNRYFDLKKCGIGWHGDKERRKVVAFRVGEDMNMQFNWFHRNSPIGPALKLTLNSGDMYLMSEKAVGTDWNKSSKITVRHSAGKAGCKYVSKERFKKKVKTSSEKTPDVKSPETPKKKKKLKIKKKKGTKLIKKTTSETPQKNL